MPGTLCSVSPACNLRCELLAISASVMELEDQLNTLLYKVTLVKGFFQSNRKAAKRSALSFCLSSPLQVHVCCVTPIATTML